MAISNLFYTKVHTKESPTIKKWISIMSEEEGKNLKGCEYHLDKKGMGKCSLNLKAILSSKLSHCVPDVVWGHRKYMGSEICHLICLDAHKPKCCVKNSEKFLIWRKLSLKF